MNKMSMWIKIAALLYAGLFLAACPTEPETETEAEKDSRLEIVNGSSYNISNIKWMDNIIKADYGNLTLGTGYDSGSAWVQSGSDYLYFTRETSEGSAVIKLRTQDKITVSGGTTFTLQNAAMVVEVDNEGNTGTLSAITPGGASTTSLKIKNESTWTISDIKWQNQSAAPASLAPSSSGTIKLGEGASGYIFFKKVLNSSGGANSTLDCRTQAVVTVEAEETGEFTFTDNTVVVEANNTANVQPLGTIARKITALTIKNQSFSDLVSVEWQGIAFVSNTIENSLTIGNTVTKEVEAGTGYIFFKRKSNPAFARTSEVVTIGAKESKEFEFTDNTLIVEANNPENTGTLKDMTTTVVFFDDAEGDEQNYEERKGSTYYAKESELPYYSSDYFHPPYTGTGKSIALGGITDAKLRLSLNLERRAKVSFRYANKDYGTNTHGAAFSIDGTEKAAWQGDYNWSNQEYTLEAGSHDLVWTKHGRYSYGYNYYSYLSLDNILVYYIE
jgi:hypothetical protein